MSFKDELVKALQWCRQDFLSAGKSGITAFILMLLSPLVVIASAFYTSEKIKNMAYMHDLMEDLIEGPRLLVLFTYFGLALMLWLVFFQRSWVIRTISAVTFLLVFNVAWTGMGQLESDIKITKHSKTFIMGTQRVSLTGYTYTKPGFPRSFFYHDLVRHKGQLIYDSVIAGHCGFDCEEVRDVKWANDSSLKLTCANHPSSEKEKENTAFSSALYVTLDQPETITYKKTPDKKQADELEWKELQKLDKETREQDREARRLANQEKNKARVQKFCKYFSEKPFN